MSMISPKTRKDAIEFLEGTIEKNKRVKEIELHYGVIRRFGMSALMTNKLLSMLKDMGKIEFNEKKRTWTLVDRALKK